MSLWKGQQDRIPEARQPDFISPKRARAREAGISTNTIKMPLFWSGLSKRSRILLRARYTFYLAQSYRDAGERKKALANYVKRASSDIGIRRSSSVSGAPLSLRDARPSKYGSRQSYVKAHEACPSRAESLYDAMRCCRAFGRFQEGYLIGKRAVTIPNPGAGLFVQAWIYEYGLFDEFSANAYLSGNYRDSLRCCQVMLSGNSLPPEHRGRVQMNADLARAKLVELNSNSAASGAMPATKGKSGRRAKSDRKMQSR